MRIAVTFTGTAGTNIPEGAVLAFDDVAEWDLRTPSDIEAADCDAAGCPGCNAAHWMFTGSAHLQLSASSHASRPLWKIPEAVI